MCISRKIAIVGVALGALGIGYTFVVHRKIKKVAKTIDKAIDNISDVLSIDVQEAIVEEAINRAVCREVNKAISTASTEAIDKARRDLQEHNLAPFKRCRACRQRRKVEREVKEEISKQYSDINDSVKKEVAKPVANFDIHTLRREVKDEAKSLVVEKFNGQLDSILQDFNQNLSNVSKIYSSIADTIAKKKESGPVFRLES